MIAKNERKIIICPKCKGEGFRLDRVNVNNSIDLPCKCKYCCGKGRVIKHTVITHTIV